MMKSFDSESIMKLLPLQLPLSFPDLPINQMVIWREHLTKDYLTLSKSNINLT